MASDYLLTPPPVGTSSGTGTQHSMCVCFCFLLMSLTLDARCVLLLALQVEDDFTNNSVARGGDFFLCSEKSMWRRFWCCRSDRPSAQDGNSMQKMNPDDGMSTDLCSVFISLSAQFLFRRGFNLFIPFTSTLCNVCPSLAYMFTRRTNAPASIGSL